MKTKCVCTGIIVALLIILSAAGASALGIDDALIRDDIKNNSLFKSRVSEPFPDVPANVFNADYSINTGEYEGKRICFASVYEFSSSADSHAGTIDSLIKAPFGFVTETFNESPVYVREDSKDEVAWTSGRFIIYIGNYNKGIVCPDIIAAYLEKYPSDVPAGNCPAFNYSGKLGYLKDSVDDMEPLYVEYASISADDEIFEKVKQLNREVREICKNNPSLGSEDECLLQTIEEIPDAIQPDVLERYSDAVEKNKQLAAENNNYSEPVEASEEGNSQGNMMLNIMSRLGGFIKKIWPFG